MEREALRRALQRCRARHPHLHTYFTRVWQDTNRRRGVLHEIAMKVFERADDLEQTDQSEHWHRLTNELVELTNLDDGDLRAAVLTNQVAILAFDEADGFADLAKLVDHSGHTHVAQIQSSLDELLETGPELPLTTALANSLARRNHIEQILLNVSGELNAARRVASHCFESGFWLLMVGVDPEYPGAPVDAVDELRDIISNGNAAVWRQQLATVALNPWSPRASRLSELGKEAELPAVSLAIDNCIKVYRHRFEESERQAVADQIRRFVRESGLTQREFAQHVGTSASRMSTYVNGLVTPSATMLLRMRRATQVIAEASATMGDIPIDHDEHARDGIDDPVLGRG